MGTICNPSQMRDLKRRKGQEMKVLLLADVKKLGYLGDVVETNAGYARNYLIPQGLAAEPTESNIRSLAREKTLRAEERIQERKRMEQACAKVDGAEAVLAAKANEQGVLFGSVTVEQIAANLREQGFEVADEIVHLAEHIKHIGTYNAELIFAEDLKARVSVVVVREGGELKEQEKVEIRESETKVAEPAASEAAAAAEDEKQPQGEAVNLQPEKEQQAQTEGKKKRRWFGRK
jgi:large subunit ribosomal protein L9